MNSSVSGSESFTYDGNQNMTFDGVNALTYDVENRLVEAQNALGTSTYLYDPLGHRKQKQVTSPGWQVTTQFVLAGGQEIADYNGTGAGAAISLTVRGVGGLPVAAITPAVDGATLSAVCYHHDVMGSTVAVTQGGASGASEAYTYSDFGAPGAGSWATYRYAGYRYDNETGLYYVNARYYNPNLGRFLQTDPIGLSGGTNLYAYVGNDPINFFDPTGRSPQEQLNDSAQQNCDAQLKYRGAVGEFNHAFWLVQDSNAQQWIIDGGPDNNGNLVAWVQPTMGYMGGHYPADNASAATSFEAGPSSAVCDQVNTMLNAVDVFNNSGPYKYDYTPADAVGMNTGGVNSNSLARWVGAQARFTPAAPPHTPDWSNNGAFPQ